MNLTDYQIGFSAGKSEYKRGTKPRVFAVDVPVPSVRERNDTGTSQRVSNDRLEYARGYMDGWWTAFTTEQDRLRR